MLSLTLSEAPGHTRTGGEFDFSPTDEDRKKLGPPDALIGQKLTVAIKEIKPYGAKISIRGAVQFPQPK